jgi:hypothetical protein
MKSRSDEDEAFGRDPEDPSWEEGERFNERFETDRKFSPEDEAMGMRDVPDDETVQGYIDATQKEKAAKGRRPGADSRKTETRDPADDRGSPPRRGKRESDEGRLHSP